MDGDEEPRDAGPFSLAWLPRAYIALLREGVDTIDHWEAMEAYYGLLEPGSAARRRNWWMEELFWSAAPPGAAILGCASDQPDVVCLATRVAGKLRVIAVNAEPESPTVVGGAGVRRSISIAGVSGLEGRVVDRDTDPAAGPMPVTAAVVDGYGIAVFAEP